MAKRRVRPEAPTWCHGYLLHPRHHRLSRSPDSPSHPVTLRPSCFTRLPTPVWSTAVPSRSSTRTKLLRLFSTPPLVETKCPSSLCHLPTNLSAFAAWAWGLSLRAHSGGNAVPTKHGSIWKYWVSCMFHDKISHQYESVGLKLIWFSLNIEVILCFKLILVWLTFSSMHSKPTFSPTSYHTMHLVRRI